MMPEPALWPLSLDYGLHDFTFQGAQGGEAFITRINEGYGSATNVEDWIALGRIMECKPVAPYSRRKASTGWGHCSG